jgi:hypothetical protein
MLVYYVNSHFEYFTTIWYILWPFGIFNGNLVYFMAAWYILPRFGILFKKSGNPASDSGRVHRLFGGEQFFPPEKWQKRFLNSKNVFFS